MCAVAISATYVAGRIVARRPASGAQHVIRVILLQLARARVVRNDHQLHGVHLVTHCLLETAIWIYCLLNAMMLHRLDSSSKKLSGWDEGNLILVPLNHLTRCELLVSFSLVVVVYFQHV